MPVQLPVDTTRTAEEALAARLARIEARLAAIEVALSKKK